MKDTFETLGPISLDIHVPAGRVQLDAAETSTTDAEVSPLGSDEASRDLAERSKIEMRAERNRKVLHIEVPRRGIPLFSRDGEVLVRVRAPIGTEVNATVGSADVLGTGAFGAAQLKTASGDVTLDSVDEADIKTASGDVALGNVLGTVKVQSASGDVDVGHVDGPGKIQTASGDVAIKEAQSNLKVQTASGDLRIDAVVSGQVSLQSASGDMRICVARGSTLWVDAKSLSGETTSDLDVGPEPPNIDGPHVDLNVTAMSGDVHIARADAPA
jgi:Putative adhesin